MEEILHSKRFSKSNAKTGDQVPYADSDFFLALMKKTDWLKPKAIAMSQKYKGRIWTSQWTVVELLLVAREYGLDTQRLVGDVFQLVEVRGATLDFFVTVASFIEDGLTVFDALHAAACSEDSIISSDKAFDEIGMKRIPL